MQDVVASFARKAESEVAMDHQTARDAILEAFESLERSTGRTDFTVAEISAFVLSRTNAFQSSTIETHVRSRLCRDAPKNHPVVYDDLTGVSRGLYRRIV